MSETLHAASDLPRLPAEPVPLFPGDYVEVAGTRLFVRRAPDGGEPAVLVHGLGGASTNWTDLMYLLGDVLDSAAIDMPGFGRSDPPADRDYSLDSHVRAVCSYVDEVVGAPVHLFGNSMGGAVATRLAAERPDLVRTLTLISPALPAYRPGRVGEPRLPLMLLPGARSWVAGGMQRQSAAERVRLMLELCYADPSRVHPVRVAEAVNEMARRGEVRWGVDALVGSLRGLVREYFRGGSRNLWRQAASLRIPTLVVCGARDRLVASAVGIRLARIARSARLLMLDDCGHVAQMEHPEVVARAFLELRHSH